MGPRKGFCCARLLSRIDNSPCVTLCRGELFVRQACPFILRGVGWPRRCPRNFKGSKKGREGSLGEC